MNLHEQILAARAKELELKAKMAAMLMAEPSLTGGLADRARAMQVLLRADGGGESEILQELADGE